MNDRKPGFYWTYRPTNADWEVAQWTGKFWLETGYARGIDENEYLEIDETPIERGKP